MRLRDICKVSIGAKITSSQYSESGIRVVRVCNLFSRPNDIKYTNIVTDRICGDGDILFSHTGTIGVRRWGGGEAVYHATIWKVTANPLLVIPDYLYYIILYKMPVFEGYISGTAQKFISKMDFENVEV